MRVTAHTLSDGLANQLNVLSNRQNRLQNQAVTGQRVQLPEDDPRATRRILDLQNESRSLQQSLQRDPSAGGDENALVSANLRCHRCATEAPDPPGGPLTLTRSGELYISLIESALSRAP